MNNTGFQTRNNYLRAALFIKLIVNNVKYRGIQCDFGRLTDVFFVTPDSLLIAVQRDTDFFQYTYCDRALNPAQKGVLNKAGFALHKCNMPQVNRKLHEENDSCTEYSSAIWKPEYGNRKLKVNQESSIHHPSFSIQHPASLNENSTVNNYKKPSACGFYIPAEGCISESRAIRACLMIRVFNN